ncbi:MAG: hypothetical protein IPN71_17810 [Fibrobacteres bacterium]|nr:hypothetical protein [Fibrobacterota bacterium]
MMFSTKALRPGMTTQDPVRDSKGMVLLPGGVTLTDSHIQQFFQRGISVVSVESNESEEDRAARQGLEKERILELFGETGATPQLEQLRRLLMERTDAA